MNFKIANRLLYGIGIGQVSTYRPNDETCIINMFRKLSQKEEKSLSSFTRFQPAENTSPFFLKKHFN